MKVLVVDDHAAVSRFLARVARQEGHEVAEGSNADEGWKLVLEHEPDVIFSDYMMPGGTGLDLLARIHEKGLQNFFVLMTGHGTEDLAAKALRLGAANYLNKPVELLELRRMLKRFDAIVTERSQQNQVRDLIVHSVLELDIGNDIDRAATVAQYLVDQCGDRFGPNERFGLVIGLQELIGNAIEHGNLGITREEKAAATNPQAMADLRRRRMAEPARAGTRVHITMETAPEGVRWTIQDEGAGFEWRRLGPAEISAEAARKGRGVALARIHFDALAFHGNGNRVSAEKLYPQSPPETRR